jgi:tRNA (uracil-5-)-methyltransferase
LTFRIDTMTNLGVGIARVNLTDHDPVVAKSQRQDTTNNNNTTIDTNDKQWVIMVRNVIPGELVKARIFRNHKKYSEADLIQVVAPSEHRIEPMCPLAGECGGCQYQHMPIDLQRAWKTTHVEACFQQNNVDLQQFNTIVQKTMGTDQVFHYRSKITPHYQAPQGNPRRNRNPGPKNDDDDQADKPIPIVQAIGFQRSSQKSIIDVPYCPIATKPLNVEYQRMREELLHQTYQTSLGATLLFRQGDVNNDTVVTDNNEYITTNVNGISFTYQAGNFFQVSPM